MRATTVRLRRALAMRSYDGLFRGAVRVLGVLLLVTLAGRLAGVGGGPTPSWARG